MNQRPLRPYQADKRRLLMPSNSKTPISRTTTGSKDQSQLAVCALTTWYARGLAFVTGGGFGCFSSPTTTSRCEDENSGLQVVTVMRLSPKLSSTATSLGETAWGLCD